jgi:hypothetical protein
MCIRKKIGVTSLPSRISFKAPESFASKGACLKKSGRPLGNSQYRPGLPSRNAKLLLIMNTIASPIRYRGRYGPGPTTTFEAKPRQNIINRHLVNEHSNLILSERCNDINGNRCSFAPAAFRQ